MSDQKSPGKETVVRRSAGHVGESPKAAPAKTPRRTYLPPLAAVVALLLANLLFGASHPLATLVLSACLTFAALLAVVFAGPGAVTIGMVVGAVAIAGFFLLSTLIDPASDPSRAAPPMASLFAAGAIWTIFYIRALRRGAMDLVWTALIWSSLAWCIWTFFTHIAQTLNGVVDPVALGSGFETMSSASLIFALLALLGAARVLHIVKQMDAEGLSRSDMIDKLLRDGLGGLLLFGFALTCLVLAGSLPGILFAGSALMLQVWWSTIDITRRDHRSRIVRWASRMMPLVAIALAAWGVVLALNETESATSGGPGLSRLQHIQVYVDIWLQSPVVGHGPGSLEATQNAAMTLHNYPSLSAPGGTRNVLIHWLVETGIVGTLAILAVLGAMLFAIVRGLSVRKTPRTFLRLALSATLLMTLHGLTDNSLDLPSAAWLYALMLGAACGVAARGREAMRQKSS